MTTFVTADWVSERIGRPDYLIIDPRSAMRYLMGHLPGAVSVPFKKLQAPDGKLADPDQLAAAFGNAGLSDDVTPVLYDHQDGRNAAMAAWGAGVPGTRRRAHHGPAVRGLERCGTGSAVPAGSHGIQGVHSEARSIRAGFLGGCRRPQERQCCWTPGPLRSSTAKLRWTTAPVISPGAVNLPHAEAAGADGNLLIEEFELRARLGIAGIANNDSVIAYCRSGVRASVAWLAMRQFGYDVRLYDGSYAEWMDSDQPVEI